MASHVKSISEGPTVSCLLCKTIPCDLPRSKMNFLSVIQEKNLVVRCVMYKSGCKWFGKLDKLYKHVVKCPHYTTSCPNGCSNIAKCDLNKHVMNECPKQIVDCKYSWAGCTARVLRCKLQEHDDEYARKHADLLDLHIKSIKTCDVSDDIVDDSMNVNFSHTKPELFQLKLSESDESENGFSMSDDDYAPVKVNTASDINAPDNIHIANITSATEDITISENVAAPDDVNITDVPVPDNINFLNNVPVPVPDDVNMIVSVPINDKINMTVNVPVSDEVNSANISNPATAASPHQSDIPAEATLLQNGDNTLVEPDSTSNNDHTLPLSTMANDIEPHTLPLLTMANGIEPHTLPLSTMANDIEPQLSSVRVTRKRRRTTKRVTKSAHPLPKTKRTSILPETDTPKVIRRSARLNLKTIKQNKQTVPEPVDDDPIRRDPNRQDDNSEGEQEQEEGAGEGDANEEGGNGEEGENGEHEDDEEDDDEKEWDDDKDYNESQDEDEESSEDQNDDDYEDPSVASVNVNGRPPPANEDDDNLKLCPPDVCIARRRNARLLWRQCNTCNQWYHAQCAGLSKYLALNLPHWTCFKCEENEPCNN